MEHLFNDKWFLMLGGGALGFLLKWFVQTIWGRNDEVRAMVRDIKQEMTEFRHYVERKYQTKELAEKIEHNLEARLTQIMDKLESIDEKLDKKVDK